MSSHAKKHRPVGREHEAQRTAPACHLPYRSATRATPACYLCTSVTDAPPCTSAAQQSMSLKSHHACCAAATTHTAEFSPPATSWHRHKHQPCTVSGAWQLAFQSRGRRWYVCHRTQHAPSQRAPADPEHSRSLAVTKLLVGGGGEAMRCPGGKFGRPKLPRELKTACNPLSF